MATLVLGLAAALAPGCRRLPRRHLQPTSAPHTRGRAVAAAAVQPRRSAVIFDADGTLLDSLPPHVDFCRRLNAELALGLDLPSPTDVAGCRAISAAPMSAFFSRAGFGDDVLARCVEAYETRFASECAVLPFSGIDSLLARLTDSGSARRLAIVSSNTVPNVEAGLGPQLSECFEFILGIDNGPADKAEAISHSLSLLGIRSAQAIYVGDTEKDAIKAAEAGVAFVGVDYGFEAMSAKREVLNGAPVARSVGELGKLLLGM